MDLTFGIPKVVHLHFFPIQAVIQEMVTQWSASKVVFAAPVR